jgi:hypothetical protein
MTKARLDGLYLLLLGSAVFLLFGVALENSAPAPLADFRGLYYPARCLVQHCDPYLESDVLRIYTAESSFEPLDTAKVRQIVTRAVYPPTAFSFTILFGMLPWGPAHILWIALTIASLIFSSFLVWSLGADDSPVLFGGLLGFLLANSEVVVIGGNAAGIDISLCAVAVWCFFRERYVFAGILCLALSLAIKPQEAGFVWLFFVLAGGMYRKRALQTLVATIAIGLPGVLWIWHVSPHWMQELNSNIAAFSANGGTNDPGLASAGAHGLGMVISLQAVTSVFSDNPRIYNPASYLIFGLLLLVWAVATLRSRMTPDKAWLALAAISALSMLPVYHRQYDAKLLMLTVPACAMLYIEGGVRGKLALVINVLGFVFTGDVVWAVLLSLIGNPHGLIARLPGQFLVAIQVFPAPMILLAMGIFYLSVFVRRCFALST